MKTIVLVNKGGGGAGDDARDRIAAALRGAKVEGEIELVAGDQLEARAKAAVEAGATLIIAAGGDGTMSAVAGALAGTDSALGILPLGTLNHLARDLGIPFDLGEAAAVIAAGHIRTIDVAELNGRTFVNNSAIGLYPLMVVDRDSQQKRLGRSKRLAMIVAALRTLSNFHEQRLRLTADGGSEMVDTPMLFVGNNKYSVAFPGAGTRETLDDGHLCVLVMRKKGLPNFLAATFRALIGRSRPDDMVTIDPLVRLRVDSRQSMVRVAIDGETVRLEPPLDYRIRPRSLKVIAPS